MCSFLFVSREHLRNFSVDINRINESQICRGPDYTGVCIFNGHLFAHNLLSISSGFSPQPYIDEAHNLILLFNGEIYNWRELASQAVSESQVIIDVFLREGIAGLKSLDGEYALLIYDSVSDELYTATDSFSTKPLHYYVGDNGVSISSLPQPIHAMTGLEPRRHQPNAIKKVSLKNPTLDNYIVLTSSVDYYPQDNLFCFEEWCRIFESAVEKRISHRNCDSRVFLPLSSGLDSGCIAASIKKFPQAQVDLVTVIGSEDPEIIRKRLQQMHPRKHTIIDREKREDTRIIRYLHENCPDFNFEIYSSSSNYNEFDLKMADDNGSKSMVLLGEFAKDNNFKICLSGHGADELYSDYGFDGDRYALHSNFGGHWPKNLKSRFPWASFYGSSMISYLLKEEFIMGSFGVESRYPFLDKELVMYSLRLKWDSRKISYKYPLQEYLSDAGFPFTDKKYGF